MPTVTLNKEVFKKLVGKEMTDEELRERIPMIGTDLESVGETTIEVEIFPNRPDLLSEQGFARAFSAFIGEKVGLREYPVKKSGEKVIIDKSVSEVRPFTACALVKGLNFDDEKIREIIQIQEKIHVTFGRNRKKLAIGIYPLEKIKLPIYYFAEDPHKVSFQPLEFPRELTGLQILSQHPTGREYGHLLEGLDKFPFFCDANKNILSMPPIINSHRTGKVSEETKEVFIECSGFDFNTCNTCLNILVTSMADMGGEVYSMELEYGAEKKITPDLTPRKMQLNVPYINKRLGLELTESEMVKILSRMGYGYDTGFVLVPAYRADILHMVDLCEDVAVGYGYENFTAEIPRVATNGEESAIEVFKRRVVEVLVGMGMLECNTYNLTSKESQNVLMGTEIELVELKSAISQEHNVLRAWMMPEMLRVLKNNRGNEYPQNIFEIGRCFKIDDSTETGVKEFERLSVALYGADVDYTSIKQVLQALEEALAVKFEYKVDVHPTFIPGRVARVFINDKAIAYIGEIAPNVLKAWDLQMPVAGFELNITELFDSMQS